MTPKESIYKVLKRIEDGVAISPWPDQTNFRFTDGIVGRGILTAEEERKILLKLEGEGALVIDFRTESEADEAYVDSHTKEELVFMVNEVIVRTVDGFESALRKYKPGFKVSGNFWQYSNPFWWVFKILNLAFKHKLVSIFVSLLMLLAVDYGLALGNLNWVMDQVVKLLETNKKPAS